MKKDRYSRRSILKAMGIGAGFLPLLNAERSPAATASGFPTRFISITWTNGTVPANFFPAGSAGPLPATLPTILQPLAAWSSKLLVLRAAKTQTSPVDINVMLDNNEKFGGHSAYPALLTGFDKGGGPSLDQAISDHLATAGVTGAQLNVSCRSGGSSTSWRSAGQKNASQSDPYKLFNSMFAGQSMPPAQVNALFQRRKSVLDFVSGELTNFASNLGTDDKVNVQNHMDSIRQLETQLQSSMTTPGGTCTPPSIMPTGLTFSNNNNYPNQVQFMSDLVAAAVICGKSRCVTMDLIDDGGGNSLNFPWLNISSPDYHAIAHQGAAGYTQKTTIDQWFYKASVAEVVGKLAAAPEGGGTVLDNTVILVSQDMNEGSNHGVFSIPYLLIGSCGGFFKTGRMVTFNSQVPNNQLLTSVAHAMGLQVAGFGNTKYTGDLDSSLTM
ncbi:MAG: DUF1552 domain-containing protein [Pseudomonadota bacterium]